MDLKRKGCTIAYDKDGHSLASDSPSISLGGRRALGLLRRSYRARRGSVLPKTVSSIAALFPSAAAVSYMRIASCMLIPSIRSGGQISMTQRAGDLPVRIPSCVIMRRCRL